MTPMTSPTSSSETDLQGEIDGLRARIIALEALVTGLQQWRLNMPFMPAPGAAGCWPPPQVVYPGTAFPPMTIQFPTNVCAAAPLPLGTYIVTTP